MHLRPVVVEDSLSTEPAARAFEPATTTMLARARASNRRRLRFAGGPTGNAGKRVLGRPGA